MERGGSSESEKEKAMPGIPFRMPSITPPTVPL